VTRSCVEQVRWSEQTPDVVGTERGKRASSHVPDSTHRRWQRPRIVRNPSYRGVMADVLLFHHILGLTPGVVAFADELRAAGHTVHTPDLYDGRTFASIEGGAGYAQGDGAPDLEALADEVAAALPEGLVYAGFSSGVMQAQRLAQQRAGATGALLFEACVPISGDWAFGPWPDGVRVQIHGMDADGFFAGDGDVDAAREIVERVDDAELFLYPGDRHLFADSSLASYDAEAAALLTERVLAFLGRI
jgi:dienelactone hydrolase